METWLRDALVRTYLCTQRGGLVGASQLSPRSVRRIARITGQDVIRGWSHGSYVLGFVTADHKHGWLDKKTDEWGWNEPDWHYTSCWETWPEEMASVRQNVTR